MSLTLPVVYDEQVLAHAPGAEIWLGVRVPDDELPERAHLIRTAVVEQGAAIVPARAHPDTALLAVHDEDLVAFLRDAYDDWVAAGLPEDPGQDLVVPYLFPTPGLLGAIAPHPPAALWARTGFYCFDTMTPIGPGTWTAARAAVDCALTAVELLQAGERRAYAITRPPGHHVARRAYGGSCYLNNAAVAAQALRDGGAERVALVDIDAHHGNGAQQVFWERGDVVTVSVHVDPATGWFPHVMGWADETGAGAGDGANVNLPVAPGTGDDGWLAALEQGLAAAAGVDAIVLALGVDAAAGDPNSPLQVTASGLREAGRRIGALGVPVVAVQEGGYDPATLGGLVVAALEGLEEGVG